VGLAVEVGAEVEVGASVGAGASVVDGLAVLEPPSPPPSHAPRVVAKPNKSAIPRNLIFITPLSPIGANTNFSLLNKIPYLSIF
jgi:hypothetical protein